MSKKRNKSPNIQTRSDVGVMLGEMFGETLALSGYTPLDQNPEIIAGCRKISNLISSMSIHLMANGKNGNERIENELSKKIDINPCSYMTRKHWMDAIVMNLILYGQGNSVVLPTTKDGRLDELIPVPAGNVSFMPLKNGGYKILLNGQPVDASEVLHFVINPDKYYMWKGQGYKVALRDVALNLSQARETEKGFMESKWKPSIIVKVDAMVDEFSSPAGRAKLLDSYVKSNEAGEPWIIPAEQFSVESVKPLSLSDLAINDTVKIDKRTVAAILGVPPFVLGEGDFNAEEWNNFISTSIMPIAEEIQQEMTKKLILKPEWFLRFNISSLMSYDIEKKANVGGEMFNRGILTGNEVRAMLGYNPKEGLDELVVLENYIPVTDVGNQNKLNGGNNE